MSPADVCGLNVVVLDVRTRKLAGLLLDASTELMFVVGMRLGGAGAFRLPTRRFRNKDLNAGEALPGLVAVEVAAAVVREVATVELEPGVELCMA